ncbi:MAG TPA: hypothetical protein PLA12_06660 [Candidatus Hydrogenedens sp.]|nr:hypothetical protein [Candidatus Hydrogenedens sp.]
MFNSKQINNRIKAAFIILILVVILGVSLYKIINYGLYLSPDSYIYLDTAQNIHHGRGIVHSFVLTSELEHWEGGSSYIPVSYWAPGFPIYIYLIKSIEKNIPFATAGAVGVWVAYLLTFISLFFLLIYNYNLQVGIWGILFFSIYYPILYTYSWVWSDGIVIPLILISLWLIMENPKPYYKPRLFLAGILAGIAFSIRYILGIVFPYGIFIIFALTLFYQNNVPRKIRMLQSILNSFVYFIGWACLSLPVIIRNFTTTGTLLGTSRPSSYIPIFKNIQYALVSLTREIFPPMIIPSEIQIQVLLALFLIYLLFIVIRKNRACIKPLIHDRFLRVFIGWGLLYFVSITLYASFYQIDTLGHRLLLPFSIVLIILMSVLSEKIIPSPYWLLAPLSVLAGVCFCYAYPVDNSPFYTTTTVLKEDARGKWICSNTRSGDWIIGDSTFDIHLLCDNRRSYCFVPGAVRDTPPNKKDFDTFFQKIPSDTTRVFIVLRKAVPLEELYYDSWIQYYGDVITELFFTGKYGNIVAVSLYSGRGLLSAEIRLQE